MANAQLSLLIDRPLDAEIWKKVDGFNGDYEISNHGRIRSITKLRRNGHVHPGKILKPWTDKRWGHQFIHLTNPDGQKTTEYIHRLVALHFVGPQPPDKPLACHNDGKPSNNYYKNIYWGTHQDNSNDRVRHGNSMKGEKCVAAKITEVTAWRVVELRKSGYTVNKICAALELRPVTVRKIVEGHTWKHLTGGRIPVGKIRA